MYFVLISIEKLIGFEKKFNKLSFIKHIYTMFFVILGWVIFRSSNIAEAFSYMGKMFGVRASGIFDAYFYLNIVENLIFIIVATIFSTPIYKIINKKVKENKFIAPIYVIGMLILFIVAISYILKGAYNPFIYFNF